MIDRDWLTCADPLAMLSWVYSPYSGTSVPAAAETTAIWRHAHRASDRTLRLYAVAVERLWLTTCRHDSEVQHGRTALPVSSILVLAEGLADDCLPPDAARWVDRSSDLLLTPDAWTAAREVARVYGASKGGDKARWCAVAREVFGSRLGTDSPPGTDPALLRRWRADPLVHGLAWAAYYQRSGKRPCGACGGLGRVIWHEGLPTVSGTAQLAGVALTAPPTLAVEACSACDGSGRLPSDCRLDADRLLVLSDSLREAGAVEEPGRGLELIRHLEGLAPCPDCLDGQAAGFPGKRQVKKVRKVPVEATNFRGGSSRGGRGTRGTLRDEVYSEWVDCTCKLSRPGWVALAVPHFRGCWVIDALLGRG